MSRADHSAVAIHDQHGPAEPLAFQRALQMRQVVDQPRADIGIDNRGNEPFVFSDPRRNLMRQRDRNLSEFAGEEFSAPQLVARVVLRPEET